MVQAETPPVALLPVVEDAGTSAGGSGGAAVTDSVTRTASTFRFSHYQIRPAAAAYEAPSTPARKPPSTTYDTVVLENGYLRVTLLPRYGGRILSMESASRRTRSSTPIEPEDLFAISRGVDWILDHAKDAIRESEVMACPPDAALADMAACIAESVRRLAEAIERLGVREDGAMPAADAAIKAERRLEKRYRDAMAALLENDDMREVTARRELDRRCSRIGDSAVEVAERVVYAVVKES